MTVNDWRFLVIGCGSIGQRHIRNLRTLGATDIIAVDPREDRRREVAQQLDTRTCASLDRALDQGPGVALVCTPTSHHLTPALEAARAGCHLFIEKPIAHTLEGLDELLAEVSRRDLRTLVGCNFRFHPGLRRVKALLNEGCLGAIVSARAQFGQYLPDWHPWEDYRQGYSAQRKLGGGVLLDRIHELDYLRWLLGEVTQVCAMTGRLSHLEIDTEDTVEMLLRFASGALGSVHLDYVRRAYDCRLEIVGDEGTVQWRYQDHSVRWHLAREGVQHSLRWPGYNGNEMYLAEMRHFLRVLAGAETAEVDAAAGKQILGLALAALAQGAA